MTSSMTDNFDCATSSLLCVENSFDEVDFNGFDDFVISPNNKSKGFHNQDFKFNDDESKSVEEVLLESEDRISEMVKRESEHLPSDDYLKRLRSGDLDLGSRSHALDWILKACARYSFGPLSICLCMNYWDRFISAYPLPKDKTWAVQLLVVACLSLATKMEENDVPQTVDLQVGDPKYVFEAKTLMRMELLVLSTLKWRMQASTPCSYIDYFLYKINGDKHPSPSTISTSVQVILSTIRGIHFLKFRPSEIAAAVAVCISGDLMQGTDIEKSASCFTHVEKGRVLKCVELIKDLALVNGLATRGSISDSSVPQSSIGVLDVVCFSYKSDEFTVGSCPNSSHCSPNTKRRKPDNNPSEKS